MFTMKKESRYQTVNDRMKHGQMTAQKLNFNQFDQLFKDGDKGFVVSSDLESHRPSIFGPL